MIFDGVGCAIVAYNLISNKEKFRQQPTIYSKIDNYISTLTSEPCVMIVADLGLTYEQIETIASNKNVSKFYYFDHHVPKYDITLLNNLSSNFNVTYVINNSSCGTKIIYDYFKDKKDLTHLDSLVNIIDTYDLWKINHEDFKKKSYPLNDLFWHYSYDMFFSRFKDGLKIFKEDIKICQELELKRREYIKNSIDNFSQVYDNKLLIITNPARGYTNDFTINYNYDFYLIFKNILEDSNKIEFSVRINTNNEYNFQDVLEKINNEWNQDKYILCGGHEKAGGVTVNFEDVDEFIDVFIKIIDNYYK